ncbi:ABC transporter ATP-binding protein [Thermococcus eurythermalis]|uniref:ABC transporter ATP-binding protein n=1 Tax=Thermococcus eurythermalis TaxID=1505907 RepID=UPI00157B1BF7|nr:ABC transporter ATP-binding protein [Thermococcus eurythermalis]
MIIRTKHLTKRFGHITALDSVSIGIGEGVTLILGPNGGGKSTFLNLCAGTYRPTEGVIRVFGGDPWADANVRQRFGVSFDPPALPKHRTGREWLEFLAEIRGGSTSDIIEAFSLGGFLDRRISTYSAGMMKRLSIASAFVGEPELVLLDEPLVNLDFDAIPEIVGLLERFASEGLSIVVVSHIWKPFLEFADRVVVIAGGRVKHDGSVEEVASALSLI